MRPDRDAWAMAMALITAQRATCLRRKVGAVFLNERGHVLATGYNGVAVGQPHCNELTNKGHIHACPGAAAPSGQSLDACGAIHAEQNALLQCRDVYAIDTAYVTASPCITCTKLLLNTSCKRIVFLEEYPHTAARALWESTWRTWEKLDFKYTFVVDKSVI
jgi:dCMP deaminase